MKTRKEWQALKKKHGIPTDAVKGISFDEELQKCHKVLTAAKPKKPDVLRAVGVFRPKVKKYTVEYKKLDARKYKKIEPFFKSINTFIDDAEDNANNTDGMVVNMQPEKAGAKSQTINKASKDISKGRSHGDDSMFGSGKDDKKHKKEKIKGKDKIDFAEAGLKGPIVIVAHGAPMGNAKVPGKVHASNFGNKSASDMIKYLAKTLPKSYSGVIYLDGCYTAAGGSPKNYLFKVYKGLVKKGYLYLQVKGNLGVAATTPDGKTEIVTWPELEKAKKHFEDSIKKLEAGKSKIIATYAKKVAEIETKEKEAMAKADDKMKVKLIKLFNDEKNKIWNKLDADSKYVKLKEQIAKYQEWIKKTKIDNFVGTAGPEKRPPK